MADLPQTQRTSLSVSEIACEQVPRFLPVIMVGDAILNGHMLEIERANICQASHVHDHPRGVRVKAVKDLIPQVYSLSRLSNVSASFREPECHCHAPGHSSYVTASR